ncbi:integrase [Alkalibacillus filiformis]|uniref:Integrase n=2 Tax=Alkalibacillus filiformis TaxID=200990 RepID=A0ABU0DPH5_9BACI|nr:integrase [Alkalibacillus filiformis]
MNTIAEETKENYLSYYKNHIGPKLGTLNIRKISPIIVQEFVYSLERKKLASSTVKRIYTIVRASLQYAVKMQILTLNSADLIEKPKENRTREVKVWDKQQVRIFLDSIENASRYTIAYKLAIFTGMRQGEILGLRWQDINFVKKYLKIQQKLTHKGKLKYGAKNKTSMRSVSLSDYILNELIKHKEIIELEKIKYNKEYNNNDLVICTEYGNACHPRNLLRLLYSHIKKTNLPRIRFHDFRHTHASLLLEADVNIKIISERLGHSSIKITLDTYLHLLPNMQQEASEKFEELLKV